MGFMSKKDMQRMLDMMFGGRRQRKRFENRGLKCHLKRVRSQEAKVSEAI